MFFREFSNILVFIFGLNQAVDSIWGLISKHGLNVQTIISKLEI